MGRANIRDPEVLRSFRRHFETFDSDARRALADAATVVSQYTDWVGREQLAYWKAQVRKRYEAVRRATYELNRAVRGPRTVMRASGFDEQKALDRAKRALEEAEQKVLLIKRWARMLEEKARPLMANCSKLDNQLARDTPKALARLDQMHDRLDDYLRPENS